MHSSVDCQLRVFTARNVLTAHKAWDDELTDELKAELDTFEAKLHDDADGADGLLVARTY